jgi:polysaccharide export outer membrane protein
MVKKLVHLGAIIAIGLMLAGCYTDFGPVAGAPALLPPPSAASSLQLADRVTVNVFGEPNLSGVYDVNPAGNLDLPLIGNVKAVGRTATELEREIARRYSSGKFVQEPQVTIAVVSYQPFYIFGEVAKPGPYPFQAGLNALTAVTTAGGLTYRGSKSTVLIQHAGEQVWTEYPLLSSVTVLPGDIIRVPERYF